MSLVFIAFVVDYAAMSHHRLQMSLVTHAIVSSVGDSMCKQF
jgi:hypothetical protein